ncbi:MAG: hypothetical protein ABI232_00795 [Jatrophihabitantaceae bacterium]
MPVTLIVEPDPGGHRFQFVHHVATLAGETDDVVLFTSAGAGASDEFRMYLSDEQFAVVECFDTIRPPTDEIARITAEYSRAHDVSVILVMDADQALKRWWRVARPAFRDVSPKPQIVFMLTRYPARVSVFDRIGWMHRAAKSGLALLAFATGMLNRIGCLAGRDDMDKGWIIKRIRDPALCTAHSRDRIAIRDRFGLPQDRQLIGIFGVINDRKNVPMVAEAVLACGSGTDLLLAGSVEADVTEWIAAQPESTRNRILVHAGFLPNDELDQLIAASDVAAVAQNNNGPSGIMGKAVAAGVPVLASGSRVKARELRALDAGVDTKLTAAAIAVGLRTLLARPRNAQRTVNLPTGEMLAEILLARRSIHSANQL